MSERFEIVEVKDGPYPLLNTAHTCCIVLVMLLDRQSDALYECMLEVRLVDGVVINAIVPEGPLGPTYTPSEEAGAYLAAHPLHAHPVIEGVRAYVRKHPGAS